MEGSSHGIIYGTIPALALRDWGIPWTICQDNYCTGQGSKWAPPRNKSEALLGESTCLVLLYLFKLFPY